MKTAVIFIFAFAGAGAYANSFVGNGGSQGDVELAVTLMQIQESWQVIEKKAAEGVALCSCNRMYNGRAICEPLNALNDTQAKFCSETLGKVAPKMVQIAKNHDKIHIQWTNNPVEVVEGKENRAVDAVAIREKNEIVINQPRFLGMAPAERVFLLSHELLHFTDLDGKPLEDRGETGPFKGDDGTRSLINAMASASGVVQGLYPKEVKSYKAKLHRSQAWKHIWLSLDAGTASPTNKYSDSFQFNSFPRVGVSARYQWDTWGLVLSYRSEQNSKKVLGTISVSEDAEILGAGVAYRIFPFSDPLTFWGQSHIVLQAMAEYTKATYHVQEDPLDFSDTTVAAFGGSFSVNGYMPLFWGIWGYVGLGYEVHPYQHVVDNFPTNYNSNLTSAWIGASYAF